MGPADKATIMITVVALLFTVGSLWWLNARRGSLTAVVPPTYAFVRGFRPRFPVAVFNSGAVPLLILDLRIVISGAGAYEWQTTRTSLMPKKDDGHAFAVPFSVKGRDTAMVIAEFGGDYSWTPEIGAAHKVRLEALVDGDAGWKELTNFTWWASPTDESMGNYIAHRSVAPSSSDVRAMRT